ncbi:MAG: tol-pal system protein YbgF [bacterium]
MRKPRKKTLGPGSDGVTRNWRGLNRATLLCVAAIFALAGCASQGKRISTRQTEMDNFRREIKFLKQQNSQFRRELDDLEKQLEELKFTNLQDKADLSSKIDEALQQMEAIQNQLQDTNYRITRFGDRPGRGLRPATADSSLQSPDTTSTRRTADSQSLAVDQSRELYNTAYRDLKRGNYQLALQGFKQFVSQHPNSDLVDNAQYWIGEVYYAQGRYQNAIDEFEKVVKWYGHGDKTASALLKIGYSYINMNEIEQGKIYLEEILNDYPDSDVANLARGRLASLN